MFTGSTFHLLSFVSMLSSEFYFDKILKHIIYAKICHRAKLQAFAKMQMIRNPSQAFQSRSMF